MKDGIVLIVSHFFTDTQAKDGHCPDCGRPIKKIREQSYFFRMSKYVDRLLQYYDENPRVY